MNQVWQSQWANKNLGGLLLSFKKGAKKIH